MNTIFNKLQKNNEFPILFIGSGISKRYLIDFPSWEELLESFWEVIGGDINFYGRLNILRDEERENRRNAKDKEVEFYTNAKMSSLIADKYDKLFNQGVLRIKNFSPKDAYSSGIDPYKMAVKEVFNNYVIKEEMKDEIEKFKKALTKSQIMITTNYDTFLEDCYNSVSKYGISKYIGQSGFFKESIGYAELYKIHGCVNEPQSIVISEEDYQEFNKNSVLISAKVISMLIRSPIVFLGYSLTDLNVRKYIKDFASSLKPDDRISLEERLIVIEWAPGENNLREETVFDPDLNCRFTVIKTDNYSRIYEILSKIDQGVAPSEIRKYHHLLRRIVVDSGREGELNSVLVSPTDLEEIEKILDKNTFNKNIVVAMGDSKIVFKTPNKLTYLQDYFYNNKDLTTDVVLRFLANEVTAARYPFIKYVSLESIENSNLHDYEKERLRQRLINHGDLDAQIKSISDSYKIKMNELSEIISMESTEDREYCIIAYNIKRLDPANVEEYIKEKVKELVSMGESSINTNLRRLFLIFDLYKNKRSDA